MKDCINNIKRELLKSCKACKRGSCCQDGVELDLQEARRISKLKLRLKKPWFEDLLKDTNLPSGWKVSTVARDGRCVFQKKNFRCRIYRHRPNFCRDFPLENGGIAEFYDYLCKRPLRLNLKTDRDFR